MTLSGLFLMIPFPFLLYRYSFNILVHTRDQASDRFDYEHL